MKQRIVESDVVGPVEVSSDGEGVDQVELWFCDETYNKRRHLPAGSVARSFVDGDQVVEQTMTPEQLGDYARARSGSCRVFLLAMDE